MIRLIKKLFGLDFSDEEIERVKKFSDLVHKHNGKILTKGRRFPKVVFEKEEDEKAYLREKVGRARK